MHKSDEWELSKENIQPLRQGRKMEILKSALNSVSDGQQHRMNLDKQKMEFESELRSYEGNDPLKPWISYIDWTEQHFPTGGMEGSLMQLIEKCIAEFMEQPKFKNDQRFIDICLKLTNIADDSLEMFNYLYGKEVGHMVASFYVAWSLALEAAGNVKKADNVFAKGIQKGAEPKTILEMRYNEFQARVVMRSQVQEDENSDDEDRRLPMSSLKTFGKKKVVSTTRTRSDISNQNQGLTGNPVPSSQKRTTFIVCRDENDRDQLCDNVAIETGATGIPMSNAESRKENEQKPGKWSNIKMKTKVGSSAASACLKFDIHTDEMQETPLKRNTSNDCVPLSVKKEQKREFAFQQLENRHLVSKPNEVPMYRRDLVHGGLQEFQFEEIRFAIYKKKQKERENERLQREQCEKLRMMEEKVVSLERKQKQFLDFVTNFLQSSGKPTNAETVSDLLRMLGQKATEQEVQDVTKRYNESLLCEGVEMDELEEEAVVKSDSNVVESSLKLSTTTYANASQRSPTIHMKEAMKIAIGIFNLEDKSSCQIASDSLPAAVKNRMEEDSTTDEQPEIKKKSQIIVYEDPTEDDQPPKDQPIAMPFVVFEDVPCDDDMENCQNVPPDDYVQVTETRKLAGFLEPSLTMPFKLLNEDSESEEEQDLDGIQPLSQPEGSSFAMPTNTIFFTNNAKFVSTPIAAFVPSSTSSTLIHETSESDPSDHRGVTSEPQTLVDETSKGAGLILAVFPRRSLVPHPGETKYDLSTIVETSRDYKSSSSGSSGASSAAASHFRSTPFRNKTTGSEASAVLDKSEKTKESFDPFDSTVINGFLNRLDPSAMIRDDIVISSCKLPRISQNTLVPLAGWSYMVSNKIGSGAYALVFKAVRIVCEDGMELDTAKEESVVLKVQSPGCPWEFYICNTLLARLKLRDFAVDVTPSIMKISRMFLYEDGSIIDTEYHDQGTLLDLINVYKKKNQTMPETLALYFTIEILHILEKIHACQIIHADIKPDNFLFISGPSIWLQTNEIGSLKLIDYGRSIDMTLFPNGTEFTVKVATEAFDCIEMKEGRPWTYQTDLYGVAACAHVMLFGQYMNPVKTADGTWKITSTIRRYWNQLAWQSFFHKILNIPSSDQLPNLAEFRTSLACCFSDTNSLSKEYAAMMKEFKEAIG